MLPGFHPANIQEFSMSNPFTPLVQSLPASVPFTGPETLERRRGAQFRARLGANESAFGISALAAEALHAHIGTSGCSWYGDPENHELRSRLAQKHGVDMDCLCVDAGIDALLGLVVRMTIEPGTPVVSSLGAYPTFNYHVAGFGGALHTVPYRDHHEDPEALLDCAIDQGARLVYLSNPDNPMGTSLSAEAVQSMIERLPEGCILLLDEAYAEFMTDHELAQLDMSNQQVLRFRTFSKAYGLAGMRIGYAMGHPDLIGGFNRIRNHFAVNRLAQIAAVASLEDADMLPSVLQQVSAGRQCIYDLAEKLGLPYLRSSTNFVTVDMGSSLRAVQLLKTLNDQGIFLRKPMVPPQDSFIRIGVGSESEHAIFTEAFTGALQA